MATITIELPNGELAGKTFQEIKKSVAAASQELSKAKIGTDEWIKAAAKLEGAKKLQEEYNEKLKNTTAASEQLKKAWNTLPGAEYFNKISDSFGMIKSGVGGLVSQFGVLKTAIAATGIGFLIVAFTTLVEWFRKTDEGATLLSGIMTGLGKVFDLAFGKALSLFQSLGEYFNGTKSIKQGLTDLVEFIGNNLLNRLKAFVVIWNGISNLDMKTVTDGFIQLASGVENGTDKMKAFADEVANAVKQGIEFEGTMDDIADQARELKVLQAETEKAVGQLLLQSKNVGLSYSERITLLDKASKLEEETHLKQLANAKRLEQATLDQLNQKNALGITDEKYDIAYTDAVIARINLEKQSIELQEKISNRRTALTEKEQAEFEKLKEKERKEWEQYYNTVQTLREADLMAMEDSREKDLQLLKFSLSKQIQELDNNAPFYAERLAAAQDAARRKRAEIDKKWNDKETNEQIRQNELQLSDHVNAISEQYLQGSITESEFLLQQKGALLEHHRAKLDIIRNAFGEESAEYKKAYGDYLNIQREIGELMEEQSQQHIQSITQSVSAGLEAFGNIFAGFAGQYEQGTRAWKNFAKAQAIVSAINGSINAYASTAAIPVVGPVLAPIAAGVALAAGLSQVKKIEATEVKAPVTKKAERGAVLSGPSHAQGGVPIEAEGDEIILTKGVYRNPILRTIASALNVAGGGISFANTGFAREGMVVPTDPFEFEDGGSVNRLRYLFGMAKHKFETQRAGELDEAMLMELKGINYNIQSLGGSMDARIDRFEVTNNLSETERGLDKIKNIRNEVNI